MARGSGGSLVCSQGPLTANERDYKVNVQSILEPWWLNILFCRRLLVPSQALLPGQARHLSTTTQGDTH